MTNWRPTKLGDEIGIAYGKSLPSQVRKPGSFGVFGSNGIVGTHSGSLVRGPGIIIGRKGSVGEVDFSRDDFWPIDTTYFVVNRNGHDWRFLYHLLRAQGLTELTVTAIALCRA
jgi:type I restriction enzyme, S subunit